MNNETCATEIGYNDFQMCKFCSSMQFDQNNQPFWKCNKYNIKLKENNNKMLVKCDKCKNK